VTPSLKRLIFSYRLAKLKRRSAIAAAEETLERASVNEPPLRRYTSMTVVWPVSPPGTGGDVHEPDLGRTQDGDGHRRIEAGSKFPSAAWRIAHVRRSALSPCAAETQTRASLILLRACRNGDWRLSQAVCR
jgi:hypothetical protein